jgi:hypothetical protein
LHIETSFPFLFILYKSYGYFITKETLSINLLSHTLFLCTQKDVCIRPFGKTSNQTSDRTHRIGQRKKVTVMRILMRHTIEEKMMQLKRRKLELFNMIMQGSLKNSGGDSLLSKSDFEFLLEIFSTSS